MESLSKRLQRDLTVNPGITAEVAALEDKVTHGQKCTGHDVSLTWSEGKISLKMDGVEFRSLEQKLADAEAMVNKLALALQKQLGQIHDRCGDQEGNCDACKEAKRLIAVHKANRKRAA